MTLSVVIAPDSFKGSLSARLAAEAIAAGWRSARAGDSIWLLPQADGGEGTLDAVESSVGGAIRHPVGLVAGPDLRPTPASWLELPGGIAVVELAEMCGLPLMAAADALAATTRGLGETIRSALDSGTRSLIVGLGGSASTDGGAGALQALGLRMTGAAGADLARGGGALLNLAAIDRSSLTPAPPDGVVLLTDVTAPLLGYAGAAMVFAPQKGADPTQVQLLEQGLARFSKLLGGDPLAPGTGAAGGTAYGLATAWGATITPGAAYIAKLSGLSDAIESADVVITGEGRFDATSLTGKVVGGVLAMTARQKTAIIAGTIAVNPGEGVWTAALAEFAGSSRAAMAEPERWLREAGRAAARHFGT